MIVINGDLILEIINEDILKELVFIDNCYKGIKVYWFCIEVKKVFEYIINIKYCYLIIII